jgi:hypothetical protein
VDELIGEAQQQRPPFQGRQPVGPEALEAFPGFVAAQSLRLALQARISLWQQQRPDRLGGGEQHRGLTQSSSVLSRFGATGAPGANRCQTRASAVAGMNGADLFLNIMLGVVGSAYLLYGRKQGALLPMLCGLLLIVAPYLVPGFLPQLLVGVGLAALPLMLRR